MRLVFAMIAVAVVAAATVFLTDNPGNVEILWQGWRVDTSVGVLVAAAALAALAVALVIWLVSLILGSPGVFFRRRRERRRRAGYEALTRGMVAVAAGDPQDARRYARRAEALLAEPPLTLLLSAQAAQIGGDELAAKKFFDAMLDRPETEFLGLRGLLGQALRDGDRDTARRLAERAAGLRPNSAWAATSLLDLEARSGRWEAALEALDRAAKRRLIDPELARHHRAVILYELSGAAVSQGDRQRALKLAGQARLLAPDLATVAAHHARLLLSEGRTGQARRAVERAWQTAPHPELAGLYGGISKDETPLARIAHFERLAAQHPSARESYTMLAEAALSAHLWGEARRHIERALAADPPPFAALPGAPGATVPRTLTGASVNGGPSRATPRLCLMMARVEEAEQGDLARSREWLDRAVHALPDPCYVCASCGGENPEWRSLCPRCGAFDELAWRTPPWAGSRGTLPIASKAAPSTEPSAPQPPLPAADPAGG